MYLYLTIIDICRFDKQPLLTAAAEVEKNRSVIYDFFCMKFAQDNKSFFFLDLDNRNYYAFDE